MPLLNLKTISPVSILDGETIAPIGDFYLKNSKIHYINHRKVNQFLHDKPELIELYSNKIKHLINLHPNRQAAVDYEKDVIRGVFREEPKNFISHVLDAKGLHKDSKIQIKTIIKTAGKPYIPGSSIKGAIKTALLYDYLTEKIAGKQLIDDTINKLNYLKTRNKDACKRFSDDLEDKISEILMKFSKIRITHSNLTKLTKDKQIQCVSFMKISDTNPTNLNNTSVYKSFRLHLTKDNGKNNIPIVTEAINPNVEFEIDVNLSKNNDYNISLTDLFDLVSIFNQEVLDYEETLLKDSKIEGKLKEELLAYYDDMHIVIGNNEDKMYLRLGSGKSNFNQSIGLAIFNKDKDAFQEYREIYKLGEKNGEMVKTFPITRSVLNYNNTQLGWVEISKKGDEK